MIVDKINRLLTNGEYINNPHLKGTVAALAGWGFERQFMENGERKAGIYMSSLGKCARQQAYKFHDFPLAGREVNSRAKLLFFQGDVVELTLTQLAFLAGCKVSAIGFQQLTISMDFKYKAGLDEEIYTVYGHPDGLYLHEDGETYLLEVKSMSSFSFKDFENGTVSEDYLAQMNIYMMALGLNKAIMVAMNKDNAVIGEQIFERDPDLVELCLNNAHSVLNSTKEALPDPKYTFDPKTRFYPWQCAYCGYWKHCKPNAEYVVARNPNKLKEKEEK